MSQLSRDFASCDTLARPAESTVQRLPRVGAPSTPLHDRVKRGARDGEERDDEQHLNNMAALEPTGARWRCPHLGQKASAKRASRRRFSAIGSSARSSSLSLSLSRSQGRRKSARRARTAKRRSDSRHVRAGRTTGKRLTSTSGSAATNRAGTCRNGALPARTLVVALPPRAARGRPSRRRATRSRPLAGRAPTDGPPHGAPGEAALRAAGNTCATPRLFASFGHAHATRLSNVSLHVFFATIEITARQSLFPTRRKGHDSSSFALLALLIERPGRDWRSGPPERRS